MCSKVSESDCDNMYGGQSTASPDSTFVQVYVLNFVFISWMHVEITIKTAPMEFYGIWSVLVAMYDCVKSHTCPLLNRISAIL